MYGAGEYDLAGFCVGAVEKDQIIDGSKVAAGDKLIGLASSGPHSNGYSLIRKVIDTYDVSLDYDIDGKALSDLVMAPTKIYVRSVLELIRQLPVHALAHITGGGIPGNLVRVLPENCHAVVDEASWQWPALFNWMMDTANIERNEMYRTFNCGVGMMIVIADEHHAEALEILNQAGENAFLMGEIRPESAEEPVKII